MFFHNFTTLCPVLIFILIVPVRQSEAWFEKLMVVYMMYYYASRVLSKSPCISLAVAFVLAHCVSLTILLMPTVSFAHSLSRHLSAPNNTKGFFVVHTLVSEQLLFLVGGARAPVSDPRGHQTVEPKNIRQPLCPFQDVQPTI